MKFGKLVSEILDKGINLFFAFIFIRRINIVCKIVVQSSQSNLFPPLLVLNILIFSDSSVLFDNKIY